MFPIIESVPDGRRGFSLEDFEERFLDICAEHRRDGRALVFGLILHDFEQSQVYQLLQDEAYWRALDTISGDRITVFAFHAPVAPEQDDHLSFWRNSRADPSTQIRSIVHRYFDLGPRLDLPSLPFFQANEDGVGDATIVGIRSMLTEEAFLEIREVLERVTSALSQVEDRYRENDQEMFNLIRVALDNLGVERVAKRTTQLLPRLLRASNG